jgi:pimeloyl-ACP methyl ester carboxylesterase
MLFDPPYGGIGLRWFQFPQIFHSWYMAFHQQPWAEDLVGSSREATRIYIRHFLSAWSANKDLWTDDEVEAYVEAYSQPGALRGGFNCYRAAIRGGGGPAPSGKLRPKTRILWGDSDSIIPFEWSDNLAEFFEDYTLQKMEGVGHFMMREAPDRVNREILEFMK